MSDIIGRLLEQNSTIYKGETRLPHRLFEMIREYDGSPVLDGQESICVATKHSLTGCINDLLSEVEKVIILFRLDEEIRRKLKDFRRDLMLELQKNGYIKIPMSYNPVKNEAKLHAVVREIIAHDKRLVRQEEMANEVADEGDQDEL